MRRVVLALLLAGLLLVPGTAARAQVTGTGAGVTSPTAGAATNGATTNGAAATNGAATNGAAEEPEGPDLCAGYAARVALPVLLESYTFSAQTLAPNGTGPLSYPFAVPPLAGPTYFGPPGLVPSYGPLGPGLTANNIYASVLAPNGFNPRGSNNVGTITGLAAQQQLELAQLNQRYANSQAYQYAAATYAISVANRALNVFNTVQNDCRNQLLPPPAPVPAAAPSSS